MQQGDPHIQAAQASFSFDGGVLPDAFSVRLLRLHEDSPPISVILRRPEDVQLLRRVREDWQAIFSVPAEACRSAEVMFEVMSQARHAVQYAHVELLHDSQFLKRACEMRGHDRADPHRRCGWNILSLCARVDTVLTGFRVAKSRATSALSKV